MDKLDKLLQRILKKDRAIIIETIAMLNAGKVDKLNIKKISGAKHFYRVKVKNYRIIFCYYNGELFINHVRRRNNKTYKNL